MTKAEEAITALQSAPARPVAALGISGVVPVPMPEAEIPAATERILAEMRLQGWAQPEASADLPADIHDALAWGVPEAAIIQHFGALILKLGSVADQSNIGHGALRRLDPSIYGMLLDGRGIGFSVWLATDGDWMRVRGYTPAEEEAVANLPENKSKFIYDFLLFQASGGLSGWRWRANDPRGASSDDRLFGEPKP